MKRFVFITASVLVFASDVSAQQYPILDAIANKVIQKYQNSSCPQLMAQRDQPRGPEEQRAIQLLRDDSQMRQAFIDRVAAPIANKLFECRMIP
jgi:ABC-type Fe2+-enterobactin transport system substrate-binding protein